MKSDGVFPVNTVERGYPGAGVGGGEKDERGREEVDTAFSWMGLTSLSKARASEYKAVPGSLMMGYHACMQRRTELRRNDDDIVCCSMAVLN
jgi:hypothetical protein